MSNAHEPLKALGPINWSDLVPDQLDTFLKNTFTHAQCIIDSIPVSPTSFPQKIDKSRSTVDSNSSDKIKALNKDWREVKVNPRENPLGLDVYKLAAKDGKGAWFARRSVHDNYTFEKWRLGMEKELDESMKVQGKPGDGSIRGIGADRKVVNQTVQNTGKMQVYQLSAQFPGPTTPRDFVTLLLSSDSVDDAPGTPKHFMLVSKPCVHPETPPRQGYIRGQYESVEFIREIRVEKPLRKTRSSIDLPNDGSRSLLRDSAENLGREATIRSARQAADSASATTDDIGRKRGKTVGAADACDDREDDDDYETMIEWLMVTRSDPGGSVPRFMIERGTPPGIAGDANKFIKWLSSKSMDDFAEDTEEMEPEQDESEIKQPTRETTASMKPTLNSANTPIAPRSLTIEQKMEDHPNPTGFYGMIANALNTAASAAAYRIPNPFGLVEGAEISSTDVSEPLNDDTSSIHSFHSLEAEGIDQIDNASPKEEGSSTQLTPSITNGGAESMRSTDSLARSTAPSQHEKELRKLEDRKRKMEEKLKRAQDRALAKRGNENAASEREEAAAQKLREKHEREIARQQEKYQREMKKLEAKRASEQKKAEERRRKTLEREEKNNLAMELDKVRAERDIARKQIDILKERMGDLQTQNTMLVARLGREGIALDGEDLVGPGIKRSMTDQTPDRENRRVEGLYS